MIDQILDIIIRLGITDIADLDVKCKEANIEGYRKAIRENYDLVQDYLASAKPPTWSKSATDVQWLVEQWMGFVKDCEVDVEAIPLTIVLSKGASENEYEFMKVNIGDVLMLTRGYSQPVTVESVFKDGRITLKFEGISPHDAAINTSLNILIRKEVEG